MGCKGHFVGPDENVVDMHKPIRWTRLLACLAPQNASESGNSEGEFIWLLCRLRERERERNLRCIIRRESSLWAVTCQLANYTLRLLLRLLAASAKSKHNRHCGGTFFLSNKKKKGKKGKKTTTTQHCNLLCVCNWTAVPHHHAVSRSLSANILTLNRCWYSRVSQRWPSL